MAGYFPDSPRMYHQVTPPTILRSAHTAVFTCFVWIAEQTASISLYSINWLVFVTETECVYCTLRTGSLYTILRSAHTAVFMCFVWIWEQTANISLYSINWLVCITERESVYCAVRTGSLYTILRSAHTAVFMCFVWIWEKTAIISLYNINWLVCITETESVYCAVRTALLNIFLVIMFRWCPAVPCVMAGHNLRHLEVAGTELSAATAGRQGLQVFLLFLLALLFRRTGVNHADGLHPPSWKHNTPSTVPDSTVLQH